MFNICTLTLMNDGDIEPFVFPADRWKHHLFITTRFVGILDMKHLDLMKEEDQRYLSEIDRLHALLHATRLTTFVPIFEIYLGDNSLGSHYQITQFTMHQDYVRLEFRLHHQNDFLSASQQVIGE